MNPQYPYISREQAEEFIEKVKKFLNQPNDNPLLHYAYGIGGIGKSTLIKKIIETLPSDFNCAKISFDVNSSINTPIDLMKALDKKLTDSGIGWHEDIFKEQYRKYEKTLKQLESDAVKGESSDSQKNKVELLKQLGNIAKATTTIVGTFASGATGKVASDAGKFLLDKGVEKGIDTLTEGGISYIKAVDLLKKHKATKNKPELQELVSKPLPKLTEAFIETIIRKSQYKPILLFIDTYEKASPEFDTFFCKFLLANEKLRKAPVRIVMAGRYSLYNKRYQRMFQQHNSLISEKQLDKFTKEETETYLKEIGITKPNEVRKFWNATKGYPYYLNLIRKQKENGKTIKLSRGGRDIVDLLLDGLSNTERKVVTLAAYCHWFDQPLIEYLLEKNNISDKPKASMSWFEWLVGRDFVIDDEHYRLDDVARDVIRQTEHKNNKNKFTQVHQQLADYYQNLAKFETSQDDLINDKYDNTEWCEYVTESTYHALFANRNKGQFQLLTHFFEGAYLGKPEVAISSFTLVAAESDLGDYKLLPGNTKSFLQSISLAIMLGWMFVDTNPNQYGISLEPEEGEIESKAGNSFKSQIEFALGKCFKEVEHLQGLAKCFGLFGTYIRSKELEKDLNLLKQAEEEIEKLGVSNYSKLSSFVFDQLGSALFELERYEEALTSYDKVIKLNPDHSNAWTNKGATLNELERYEEALTSYDKAIELNPDNSNAWSNKGATLGNLERYEEALTSCNKAIELNPDHSNAWTSKGATLNELERYEEALTSYDKAIELNTDNSNAWSNKGATFNNLERYEEALTSYDKAIELNSDSSIALINKALLSSKKGDFDYAIADVNQAIKIATHEVLAISSKGMILARKGDYNQALEFCNQAISKNTNHEAGYYAKSCYYALQNEEQKAIESLSKAIDIAPRKCRREAKINPDFNNLKNNPQFQALLNGN